MLQTKRNTHDIGAMEYEYGGFNGSEYDGIYAGNFEDYYLNYTPPPPTPLENFVKYFYTIVFPYFLLSGTFGNIIGMILMRRYSHNVWSTCLYMSLIFPLDLIQLYVECGNDWLIVLHTKRYSLSEEILLLSNAVCKVYTFIYNFILSQSEWVTVAIAIETFIAIRKPDWIYTMCTRERASAIVLFISVLLISLNLHFFWTYGLIKPGQDPSINAFYCTYINELSDSFRDYIWPIINVCIEDAVPFLIIIVCITLSIPRLAAKRKYVWEKEKHLEKYFLDVKALHDLNVATFVTCIVTVLYLICNITIKALIYEILIMDYEETLLMRTLLVIFTYIFMSHKFWIYYIACEKFRQDVKGLIMSLCAPFQGKTCRTYARAPTLSDRTHDATVSWQENEMETTFSKELQGAYSLTE